VDHPSLSRYTVSFGLSAALSSVVNALLVVAKEKSPAIQAAMQRITGHHWVTHSAFVILLFGFLGWLFARANGGHGPKISANALIGAIAGGVALAGAMIVAFYLMAD